MPDDSIDDSTTPEAPTAGPSRPGVTLDVTGLSCPGPIIGVKKLIMEMEPGEVLMLISDCPATREDLFTWAQHTNNRVLRTERRANGATAYFVQRGESRRPVPDAELDLRGVVCPGPIVEARALLKAMPPGGLLKLISNCPGDRDDVEGWARQTDVTLEDVVEVGTHAWEFYLRKRR
ncbi:MAG: sulfurtransferase TusA family protein [Lautropia sp.]